MRPCVALSSAAWGLFCSIFGLVNLLFSLLFLSSRNEQNQKNVNKSMAFFSTLPHYILVRFQRNGREKTRKRWEYPVNSLREKDGTGKESRQNFVTFLNISYTFLFVSNYISLHFHSFSYFSPIISGNREKEIGKDWILMGSLARIS